MIITLVLIALEKQINFLLKIQGMGNQLLGYQ